MSDQFNPFEKPAPDPERPLADLSDDELKALGAGVGVHVGFPGSKEEGPKPIPPPSPGPPPPKDADPDEEPPEPEGHALPREVAAWINHGQEYFHGPLPHDLAAIWGFPPMRVGDEATARILIAAWGMDGFRGSALHQAALSDRARQVNSAEVTARFKAERTKKGKR